MPYMLLVMEPPNQRAARTKTEGQEVYDRMKRFGQELQDQGLLLAGQSLRSHVDAARVEVRGGRPRIVDGPFAEAKEMVGGYFLIDCKTRDEALAIAARCPAAEWCTVEVRSFAPCNEESAA